MVATPSEAREVRRVSVLEFNADILRFYTEFAHEPIIVTGVYDHNAFLSSLTIDDLEQRFRDTIIYGYQRKSDATGRVREAIQSEDFFADLKGGASRYYVFDHAVAESPFFGKVTTPSFLRQNWLDDQYALTLTVSGKGSFSPLHEDGSGEQAWMYLIMGEKHWEIYPPVTRPLLWDSLYKDFYNPRTSDPSRFPYLKHAESARMHAVAKGGELIFLPPGWIHQVLTTQDSFGLGGNIVNEFQSYQSMETGLNEKSHALRHDFNLIELMHAMQGKTETKYGERELRAAIALGLQWQQRIHNKSDSLVAQIAGVA